MKINRDSARRLYSLTLLAVLASLGLYIAWQDATDSSATEPAKQTAAPAGKQVGGEAARASMLTGGDLTPLGTDAYRHAEDSGSRLQRAVLASMTDYEAAHELAAHIAICGYLLDSNKAEHDQRLGSELLRQHALDCTESTYAEMQSALGAAARPGSADWERLENAMQGDDTSEGRLKLDQVALDLLSSSDEPELLASAAQAYFEVERVRARFEGRMPPTLAGPEHRAVLTDLALAASCLGGRGCEGNATRVVAECLATPGCRLGGSMWDVISVRRSPIELAMIRELLDEIRRRRAGR